MKAFSHQEEFWIMSYLWKKKKKKVVQNKMVPDFISHMFWSLLKKIAIRIADPNSKFLKKR